jgi:tRNA-binding protein
VDGAQAFATLDVRVGTIAEVKPFPAARKPAYQLVIDFGPQIGRKQSSAQLTQHYKPDELVGRQVIAAMNLGPKKIADFTSEVLVLGLPDIGNHVVLLSPDLPVPNGARLY